MFRYISKFCFAVIYFVEYYKREKKWGKAAYRINNPFFKPEFPNNFNAALYTSSVHIIIPHNFKYMIS